VKHKHRRVRAQAHADPCTLDRHSNSPAPLPPPTPFLVFSVCFPTPIVPHCSNSHVSLYPFILVIKTTRFSAAAAAVCACIFFGTCWHRSGGCARPRGASAKTAFPLQASSVRSIERTLQQWLRAFFPFVDSVDIGAFKRTFYPTCIFAPKQQGREILLRRHPCSSSTCETVTDFGSISPKRQL